MAKPIVLKEQQVIEDAFIHKMLLNPKYLAAFPFLKQYASIAKSCGTCGQKGRTKAIDFTEIKRTLVAMPPEKQAQLIQMAQAKSVRIIYRNRNGEVVKFTINAKA